MCRLLAWAALVVALLLARAAYAQETDEAQPGAGYVATVRLTHYWEAGTTYGGGRTFVGSAACSWNFALGTRFMLPTGETFVCTDRGRLGNGYPYGWLDLYGVNRDYLGTYVDVAVIP